MPKTSSRGNGPLGTAASVIGFSKCSSNRTKPPSSDGFKLRPKFLRSNNSGRKPGDWPCHPGQTLLKSEAPAITAAFSSGVSAPAQYGPAVQAAVAYLGVRQVIPCVRTVEILQDLFDHRSSAGSVVQAVLLGLDRPPTLDFQDDPLPVMFVEMPAAARRRKLGRPLSSILGPVRIGNEDWQRGTAAANTQPRNWNPILQRLDHSQRSTCSRAGDRAHDHSGELLVLASAADRIATDQSPASR